MPPSDGLCPTCCSKGLSATLFFTGFCVISFVLLSAQPPRNVRVTSWSSQQPPAQGATETVPTPRDHWAAAAPPASEYCESRGHGSAALLVMLGPPNSGRTLENALRNVASPLCAWTLLINVVDNAAHCQHSSKLPPLTDADTEALLARVATEVEPPALRESLGPRLEALGSVRHLVSEDRRECGHIAEPPPPPLPLRHFGWEVHDGPCVTVEVGGLPAAARDGAVTSFRDRNGTWQHVVGSNASQVPISWLPEVIKRARQATFGVDDAAIGGESAVVDVRGAADFAVVGGLTGPESQAAANFDGAQTDVHQGGVKQPNRTAAEDFPGIPETSFASQNNVNDFGDSEPTPNPLVRGTSLNVTVRPIPRLAPSTSGIAPALVLRKACPSPETMFCRGNAMDPCVRRARWLSQLLIGIAEQDSFGDEVAFDARAPSWAPKKSSSAAGGDDGDGDVLLSFPAPRSRIRPLQTINNTRNLTSSSSSSSSSPPARCAAHRNDGSPGSKRRSLALLYTGQLRTGRKVLPASLKQLAGNALTTFVAMAVPGLDDGVREELDFYYSSLARAHRGVAAPLGGMFLLNRSRTLNLRNDKAEYPHPRSWKTIPELSTDNIVSQHYMLLAVSTMAFLYEQRCNVRFDFFVRTRPDSLYRWPLPPSALPRLYPGVLVADKGWDWESGLSDQFVFGPAWLIGNFLDVAAVYPQMLVEDRLRFTHVEMIHRFTLEILNFPFAKLVRTSRRVTFLVREDYFHLSVMHRQVLASLNVSLPRACRPRPDLKYIRHAVRFDNDAPFCELRAPPS